MNNCFLCENKCGVDRSNQVGRCKVDTLKIARYALHMYEEPVISGTNGSGTIFFCGCPLSCVFCQNYDVSRNLVGKEITVNKLVEIMKELESQNAHNINFVNPTHYAREIIQALTIYKPSIPTVWNTHGYDSEETIKMTEGLIDIFLPDFKYFDDTLAKRYSNVTHYKESAIKSITAMRSMVKDSFDDNGMMKSGVIIRHLILPKCYRDSINVLDVIADKFPNTLVSVMSQYTPFGDLTNYKEINRKLFSAEIEKVQNHAMELNSNGFFQDKDSSSEEYIPTWDFKG